MGHEKVPLKNARAVPAKDRSISGAKYQTGKSHATEYAILGNPGLVIVVMKAKGDAPSVRIWRCRYSITRDGVRHQRRVRIGAYPHTTLAMARAAAATIMAEVDRGGDPYANQKRSFLDGKCKSFTFSDLVNDYLAERREQRAFINCRDKAGIGEGCDSDIRKQASGKYYARRY